MLKRVVYIGNPFRLSHRDEQLKLLTTENGEEAASIPFEDLGVLVLDHPRISVTQRVLQACGERNIALIVCDAKHHPTSLMLHLDTHSIQTELFRHQIDASLPLKKQLWKQTVAAKIRNQGKLLEKIGKEGGFLLKLAGEVQSGDSGNAEAIAARYYWNRLYGGDFRRERFGDIHNAALNYGYAILRAAVARALCGSGLLPTLGIHHHNRYNAYCLADDMMEPFRPYVDEAVFEIRGDLEKSEDLEQEHKAHLLSVMQRDVHFANVMRPLMPGLSHTTASLSRCLEGKEKRLAFPLLV